MTNSRPIRIAMWSGPRNLSTAMMRSFGNRADTFVTDEPLYAHFLKATDIDHPMQAKIIASQETDPRKVTDWLNGPIPEGKSIWYQKHMAHHLFRGMDRGWLHGLTNCILIRDPVDVLHSYARKRDKVTFQDLGYELLVELFFYLRKITGNSPPVLDARDILLDPRRVLGKFCKQVGVVFTDDMLQWPPGPQPTDGIWGKYWYQSIEASTGFQAYSPPAVDLPEQLMALARECQPYYNELYARRLTV